MKNVFEEEFVQKVFDDLVEKEKKKLQKERIEEFYKIIGKPMKETNVNSQKSNDSI